MENENRRFLRRSSNAVRKPRPDKLANDVCAYCKAADGHWKDDCPRKKRSRVSEPSVAPAAPLAPPPAALPLHLLPLPYLVHSHMKYVSLLELAMFGNSDLRRLLFPPFPPVRAVSPAGSTPPSPSIAPTPSESPVEPVESVTSVESKRSPAQAESPAVEPAQAESPAVESKRSSIALAQLPAAEVATDRNDDLPTAESDRAVEVRAESEPAVSTPTELPAASVPAAAEPIAPAQDEEPATAPVPVSVRPAAAAETAASAAVTEQAPPFEAKRVVAASPEPIRIETRWYTARGRDISPEEIRFYGCVDPDGVWPLRDEWEQMVLAEPAPASPLPERAWVHKPTDYEKNEEVKMMFAAAASVDASWKAAGVKRRKKKRK